jgi:uncharacterized protein (TIGR03435 family)
MPHRTGRPSGFIPRTSDFVLRTFTFLVLSLFALSLAAGSQTDVPAFEVASVKPNQSGEVRFTFTYQGSTFKATNATLRMLIRNAYQVQDSQIFGGPSWLNDDRFDIVAKGDVGASPAFPVTQREGPSRLQQMIRTLLAERFKLAVHIAGRDQPVFALVVARSDGRLGPTLHRTDADCASMAAATRAGTLPASPAQTRCVASVGLGTMTLGGATLFQFANSLSRLVGRPVVDQTGLAGNFDITLTWTPAPLSPPPTDATNARPGESNGPSIFTAVQEQLGLKLASQRGQADVLVIDHVEKPAEN